jgi:uncharacterized protein YecT (DUF1311 family)
VARISFIACLVLSVLNCARAEERTSETYTACLDKAGGVTGAMQDCIKEEIERQDRGLNTAYQSLMNSVPEKRQRQLRDAQRKWVSFRDANCRFYFDPEGGSAARLASNECVVTITADRSHELENLKRK